MAACTIILGSNGQIGTELVDALRVTYGEQWIIAADIRTPHGDDAIMPFENFDVADRKALHVLFAKYRPTQVYLLAAMLSANGEKNPLQTCDTNVDDLLNVSLLAGSLFRSGGHGHRHAIKS